MARVFVPDYLQHTMASGGFDAVGCTTVVEALFRMFMAHPWLIRDLLNDEGWLRDRLAVSVDGHEVFDRVRLTDFVGADSEVRLTSRADQPRH